MRHRKKTVKLGRTSAHKRAMLRNLVSSLILHEKIRTSKARAKAARTLADKVIHLAITGNDTATRRRVFQLLGNKEVIKHLFDEVSGRFSKNSGGYTRIVPYGNQLGDNSEKVFFAFAYDVAEKEKKKSTMKLRFRKKKSDKKQPSIKAKELKAEPKKSKEVAEAKEGAGSTNGETPSRESDTGEEPATPLKGEKDEVKEKKEGDKTPENNDS